VNLQWLGGAGALLACAVALAEEPPDPVAGAAERVRAALLAKDEAALRAIGSADGPDPWVVADHLCARDDHEAALAFARTLPEPERGPLMRYVGTVRGAPVDAAVRTMLAEVLAAEERNDNEALLLTVDSVEAQGSVPMIRLLSARAAALGQLKRFAESLATSRRGAETAEALGWVSARRAFLVQMSRAARRMRDYDTACAMLDAAESLATARGVGAVLLARTEVAWDLGDWEAQVANARLAWGHYRERGDLSGLIEAAEHLRIAGRRDGDGEEATAAYEELCALARSASDFAVLSAAQAGLGEVFADRGMLGEALHWYREAEATAERAPRVESRILVSTRLAAFYRDCDKFGEARDHYRRTLAYWRDVGDVAGMASVLSDLATNFGLEGDATGAEDCARELVTLSHRARTEQERMGVLFDAASSFGSAANEWAAARSLGDPRGAEGVARAASASARLGEEALSLCLRLGDRIALPHFLSRVAQARSSLREYAKALPNAMQAVSAADANGQSTLAVSLRLLAAIMLAEMGRADDALSLLEEADSGASALGLLKELHLCVQQRANICLKIKEDARCIEAQREATLLAWRLADTLPEQHSAAARSSRFPSCGLVASCRSMRVDDFVFFAEAARAGALLSALGGRGRVDATTLPGELLATVAEARAQEERAWEALRAAIGSGHRPSIAARRESLAKAQAALLSAEERLQVESRRRTPLAWHEPALLAEIQAALRPGETMLLPEILLERQIVAAVLTRDAARLVTLGDFAPVRAAAQASVEDRALADARLREVLAGQLGPGINRLLVSPVGLFFDLPYARILPDLEVSLIPSGTALALLRKRAPSDTQRILALGGASYADGLAHLPASRAEATSVGDETLLGDRATKEALLASLVSGPWRSIHLACHAQSDVETPALSSLLLTPMGDDGGRLSVPEILRVGVRTDLAVLSACETARGKQIGGESFGLLHAFMAAGAPRVIASLWKVDDDATRELMVRFYALWNPGDGTPGLPAATALRRAQHHVAAQPKWTAPEYWAAW